MLNNPGNPIAYIFQFPDTGSAARDAVVGAYPLTNMELFDTSVSSVTPLSGYWPLVVQPYPLVSALYSHPNIQLVINQALPSLGPTAQPTVILSNIPALAHLQIITVGVSTYAPPGLQLQPIGSG